MVSICDSADIAERDLAVIPALVNFDLRGVRDCTRLTTHNATGDENESEPALCFSWDSIRRILPSRSPDTAKDGDHVAHHRRAEAGDR